MTGPDLTEPADAAGGAVAVAGDGLVVSVVVDRDQCPGQPLGGRYAKCMARLADLSRVYDALAAEIGKTRPAFAAFSLQIDRAMESHYRQISGSRPPGSWKTKRLAKKRRRAIVSTWWNWAQDQPDATSHFTG